jgi:hypothetical protein
VQTFKCIEYDPISSVASCQGRVKIESQLIIGEVLSHRLRCLGQWAALVYDSIGYLPLQG